MEEIELAAENALAGVPEYIWNGRSLPVPIEQIASSHFCLLVKEVEDMAAAPGCPPLGDGQSLSGLLLASRRQIWVNADEARRWAGRRRFTIGHELGHWVLHRQGQQSLFCRHGSVEAPEAAVAAKPPGPAKAPTTKPPLPITEEEANVFAAALLMPAELVRFHYKRTTREFNELCEMFGASGAAMGRRLRAVI